MEPAVEDARSESHQVGVGQLRRVGLLGETTLAPSTWAMLSATRRVLPCDTEVHTMTVLILTIPSLASSGKDRRGGVGCDIPRV